MKTIIKLSSFLALIVLPFFISGCEKKDVNDSSLSSYDFLLDYGKYLGMSKSNIEADLYKQNWTLVQNKNRRDEYSLQVNGHNATLDVMYDSANKGISISFDVENMSNAMEVAEHLYNKVGETYTLTTVGQTLAFERVNMTLAENDDERNRPEIKSYEEGKSAFSNKSYAVVGANWSASVSHTYYGFSFEAEREEGYFGLLIHSDTDI